MNVKENWSVLKYIGKTSPNTFGLTHGRYYYWLCSVEHPEYEGIIDDEEFTSYIAYAIDEPKFFDGDIVIKGRKFAGYWISSVWEIAEDPTGMAAKVLSGEIDIFGKRKKKLQIEK